MPMNDPCAGAVQGCRLVIARLWDDGVPAPGLTNLYISRSLVTFAVTNVYTDGTEIEEQNACGEVEIYYKAPDTFKRVDIEITLLTPDPYVSEMLSAGSALLDTTEAIGYKAPPLGLVPDDAVSIEVYQKRIVGGKLDPQYPYLRWVFPFVTNLRPGDFTIGNEALKPVFVGQGYENVNWYDGPQNDWPEPDDSEAVYSRVPATVLPDYQCGYIELVSS